MQYTIFEKAIKDIEEKYFDNKNCKGFYNLLKSLLEKDIASI